MTSMEWETLDVIGKNENRIHYYLLAQELGISAGYAYIICRGLKRSGYGDFDTFRGICSLTEKGKDTIEKSWLLKLKKHKEKPGLISMRELSSKAGFEISYTCMLCKSLEKQDYLGFFTPTSCRITARGKNLAG